MITEDESMRSFRRRFGNEIPDNVLNLVLREVDAKTVISHNIGRELTYDIIKELAIAISQRLDVKNNFDNSLVISIYKELLFEFVKIILPLLEIQEGKGVLSQDEKAILLKKLGKGEFAELAKIMNTSDMFYFAYNTKAGIAVKDYLTSNIDKLVESVYIQNHVSDIAYYYNCYSAIADKWKNRLDLRERALIESRKIIYGSVK